MVLVKNKKNTSNDNPPEGLQRGDIERGVGNYLISKNVPILDFYSHNY